MPSSDRTSRSSSRRTSPRARLRTGACVVLKKAGKHFAAKDAAHYVGGYVIFNDITARDIQREEMKSGVFSFCKGIDSFCPLGPHIVTADEIKDPHNLAMELRVNGEVRQRSHSSKMSVTIPEILAHYSPMGYSAGDVVSTGTVSGVAAFSADPKAWFLKPGDVMECEIEQIGVLAQSGDLVGAGLRREAAGLDCREAGSRAMSDLAGKVWTSELNSRPDVRS